MCEHTYMRFSKTLATLAQLWFAPASNAIKQLYPPIIFICQLLQPPAHELLATVFLGSFLGDLGKRLVL